jgi:adenine nucleotide transporter 17
MGPGEIFLIGALAKIGATIVTYPMIVVKSRLQAMGRHSDQQSSYLGTSDAIGRIWSQEGPGGFFKGLPPKVLQTAINAALMLMVKDRITNESERLLGALASAKSKVQGQAVYAVVYR